MIRPRPLDLGDGRRTGAVHRGEDLLHGV